MDHADYRQKYDRPYSDNHFNKWSRMAKQMLDARHVADDSGYYIGGAGSNFRQNPAGGAEVGVTNYSLPWLSSKLALAGQLNSGARNAFVGMNSAVHVSTPTRVAPFIGAGLFGGVDIATVINTLGNDDEDDEDDDVEDTKTQFLGAIYPEAGVHVWLTGRTRLSASASYWVTTEGRHDDFWYYGLGLTFSFGPESRTSKSGEVLGEKDFVNRLLDNREQLESRAPSASLTAGQAGEKTSNDEPTQPAKPLEQESRTEFVEQVEFRSPSILDRVFPPAAPPLELPAPPVSRVLPPQRMPEYVEPPTN